jgi:hypothetical protein
VGALVVDELDQGDAGGGVALHGRLGDVDVPAGRAPEALLQLLRDLRVGVARVDQANHVAAGVEGLAAAGVVLEGEDQAVRLAAGRGLLVDDPEEDLALELVQRREIDTGGRGVVGGGRRSSGGLGGDGGGGGCARVGRVLATGALEGCDGDQDGLQHWPKV